MAPDPARPPGDSAPREPGTSGCPAPPASPIVCAKHGMELVMTKVQVAYQGHAFPVEVPACPICRQPLLTEELVRGRMLEVEQTLEEK